MGALTEPYVTGSALSSIYWVQSNITHHKRAIMVRGSLGQVFPNPQVQVLVAWVSNVEPENDLT